MQMDTVKVNTLFDKPYTSKHVLRDQSLSINNETRVFFFRFFKKTFVTEAYKYMEMLTFIASNYYKPRIFTDNVTTLKFQLVLVLCYI